MNSGEDQSTNEAMSAVNDAALTSKAGRNMLSKAVDEFTPGPRFSDTNQKILNLLIKTLGVVDLRTGDASQTKVTAAPATAPTDDPDASKAT